MTGVPARQALLLSHQGGPLLLPTENHGYRWSGVIAAGVLLLLGMLLILLDEPPKALSNAAPPTQFSAERALRHVEMISRAPHPVGSAEHLVVENYILDVLREIGLKPQVQKAIAKDRWLGSPIELENIVAGIKGSTPGKAVLLVAHYDSVAAGPGASDDGAAVAALLEAARIFKSLPQFKRDIFFLFTDGEEPGLLGAKAFVAENAVAKDVGIVLNFEARGSSGPVILFETSDQNAWLMDNVSKAASHPVANSLSYEIYKRLPNDTDFTVFKRAGYPGLNFAFIGGLANYHTANDNLQNLNRGSLQHHGDYAVELGARFANLDRIEAGRGRAIYFDILGRTLVHYSPAIGALLLVTAGILLAFILFRGFHRRRLTATGLVVSLLMTLAAVIAAAITSLMVQRITAILAAHYHRIHTGVLYHPGYYVAAAGAAGMAVAAMLYTWSAKRFGAANAGVAGLLVWFALSLWATIWVQGMSYLWAWPLLFNALAWALVLQTNRDDRSRLLLAGTLPGMLILIPMAHKIFTAFVLSSSFMVSALLALLLALCAGPLGPHVMPRRSALPLGLCIAGVALFAIALAL